MHNFVSHIHRWKPRWRRQRAATSSNIGGTLGGRFGVSRCDESACGATII